MSPFTTVLYCAVVEETAALLKSGSPAICTLNWSFGQIEQA